MELPFDLSVACLQRLKEKGPGPFYSFWIITFRWL